MVNLTSDSQLVIVLECERMAVAHECVGMKNFYGKKIEEDPTSFEPRVKAYLG